jgi:hypothetical protein
VDCNERSVHPLYSRTLPAIATALAATTAATAIATVEARFAGFGLVDPDISTLELSIVELLYCLGSVLRICHFDEAEALD